MYIVGLADEQSRFHECVFEENIAEDGGAVYLYTARGTNSFIASVFRNNYAGESVGTSSITCGMDLCSAVKNS